MPAPNSTFVYVTYIRATPERVWSALVDREFTRKYWFGMDVESEWKVGAPWRPSFSDGRTADSGEIVEFEPPRRLAIRWRNEFRPELTAEGWSLCVMEVEDSEGAAKLTVTHSIEREGAKLIEAVSGGWPKILSNLKSLLETGEPALAETN
jgi:uncharacterized protein YndB with AHSA1/START domain